MPACEACRISDTACDLGRPKCSSCTTRSLACVYQPSRDGYTFVDQNAVAARASRRAANRRSRAPTASFPLSIREENPIVAGPATGLPAPVLYSLDDRAIRRFFSRWAVGETCVNCIEFMPRLHEASGEDSPIRCAVLATAYADLAVSERHGDHRSQSHGTYLKTLRRLQTQLLDPNFIPSDNIFAAILAVDAFELSYMGRPPPEGIHAQAIVRILELRRDYAYEDPQSFTLSRAAYHRIQVRQLLSGLPSLSNAKLRYLNIEGISRLNSYTVRFAADACDAVAQLETERNKPADDVDGRRIVSLCTALRVLMRSAHDWFKHSFNIPQPRQVAFDLSPESGMKYTFPRSSTTIHDDTLMAREWLLFRVCCIKMLNLLIDIRAYDFVRHADRTIEAIRVFLLDVQQNISALNAGCQSTLDMIPFIIGLVDSSGSEIASWPPFNDNGLLTVKHPLWTIAQSEYVLPDVKAEASRILQLFESYRNIVEWLEQ